MKLKMKRFLGILLSLTLMLGLMPGMSLTAYAAEQKVTFTAGGTNNGITVSPTMYNSKFEAFFVNNKGQNVSISSSNYNITKLVLTDKKLYSGQWGDSYLGASAGNVSFSGDTMTVTGINAKTVTIQGKNSKYATIGSIDVYYDVPDGYSVTINPGSNMTKTDGSGAASQTGLSGAMTDVVYTADVGYYFPTDYSVAEVNGITVTRDSYTQITVSGTPTANAMITLTAPTAKTTPDAPTTATATDCTTAANNDGKLTGVTAEMEYKKSDASDWTAGTGSDITGLVPGTYYVRYKATDTTNASGNQELSIAGYTAPTYEVTYKVVNGTWSDDSTTDKKETVQSGSKPASVPTSMKAASGYTGGAWDTDPADATITGATTFTYTFTALPTYEVTYKVVNGTWLDDSTTDKTETVQSGSKPASVPTGMKAASGYTGGTWDTDPANATITGATTFTYSFTAIPTYEVTYKVSNGTWSDDSTEDKSETVQSGAKPASVPTGMKAASGYTGGTWDTDPANATITGATTFTYTFTAKQAATVTKAPEAKTLTYTGSAQELVTAGTATGGEMQYALGTATEATQPYTTSIPTATNAGTYYVWYRAVGNENYNGSTPGCVEATIAKAYQTLDPNVLPEESEPSYAVTVALPAGDNSSDYEYVIVEGDDKPLPADPSWKQLPAIRDGQFIPEGLTRIYHGTIWLRRKADANHNASEAISKNIQTPEKVLLSYDANGGSGKLPEAKLYEPGATTDAIAAGTGISRYGYTFNGWNTAADGRDLSLAAGATWVINSRTILYAQWRANPYTVSFNANGGTGSMDVQHFEFDTAKALTRNQITKEHFSFLGWALEPDGEVVYTDEQSVKNLVPDGEVTLYAIWGGSAYQISGYVKKADHRAADGAKVTFMRGDVKYGPATTGSDGSYVCMGVPDGYYNVIAEYGAPESPDYRKKTALMEVKHQRVDTIILPSQNANSVVKVLPNTPAVMVGDLDEVAEDEKEEGKEVTVTMTVETKSKTEAEGAAAIKALAESSSAASVDVEVDYLNIEIKKMVSDGQTTTDETIRETDHVVEMIVPFNFANRKNCELFRYHDGIAAKFTALSARPMGSFRDATFYGDRENSRMYVYGKLFSTYAISYETASQVTVTFRKNDGTEEQITQDMALGTVTPLTANSFSRTGHSFSKWNTEANGNGTDYADGQTVILDNDLVLYAQWTQNYVPPTPPSPTYYTVTFDMGGHGTAITSQTIQSGSKVTKPEDPTEDGFVFGGWFTDPEYKNIYDFTETVGNNFTLYAKWITADTETFAVGFDLNGKTGTAPDAQTVKKGEKAVRPNDPATEGYKFTGWFTDKDGKNAYDFDTPVNADLKLYAGWEKKEEQEIEGFEIHFAALADNPYDGVCYNSENKRYETVYTGAAITPLIKVTSAVEGVLKEEVDYKVSYSNNKNASTNKPATISVTGKGTFKDTKTLELHILPADLQTAKAKGLLVMADELKIQKGNKLNPVMVYRGYELKAKDRTLSNPAAINENTNISITGKSNFTGTLENIPVSIMTKEEAKATAIKVTLKAEKHVYNGKAHELTVTTKEAAGELTVTAGSGKTPLTKDTDFVVSYSNNIDAGTAKVTVTGIGSGTGTVVKSFKIEADKESKMTTTLADPDAPVYYSVKGAMPEIIVTKGEVTDAEVLELGKDYKVTYSSHKKVGDGAYTVKFLGNYKGHKDVKGGFKIVQAPISTAKVEAMQMIYKNPGNYLSKPFVSLDGVQLKTSDYTYKYYLGGEEITSKYKLTLEDGETSKTVKIVVTGKGNYSDTTAEGTYEVVRRGAESIDLTKAKIVAKDKVKGKDVSVAKQEYNGYAIEPEIRVMVRMNKKWVDVDPADYTVSYINNVNKGTATILVSGNGTETIGSKTARFSINTMCFERFNLIFWK